MSGISNEELKEKYGRTDAEIKEKRRKGNCLICNRTGVNNNGPGNGLCFTCSNERDEMQLAELHKNKEKCDICGKYYEEVYHLIGDAYCKICLKKNTTIAKHNKRLMHDDKFLDSGYSPVDFAKAYGIQKSYASSILSVMSQAGMIRRVRKKEMGMKGKGYYYFANDGEKNPQTVIPASNTKEVKRLEEMNKKLSDELAQIKNLNGEYVKELNHKENLLLAKESEIEELRSVINEAANPLMRLLRVSSVNHNVSINPLDLIEQVSK